MGIQKNPNWRLEIVECRHCCWWNKRNKRDFLRIIAYRNPRRCAFSCRLFSHWEKKCALINFTTLLQKKKNNTPNNKKLCEVINLLRKSVQDYLNLEIEYTKKKMRNKNRNLMLNDYDLNQSLVLLPHRHFWWVLKSSSI